MKHLESFEEKTSKITTELCVEYIVNHFTLLNSTEELCNPKNWKRVSKKGIDSIIRIFKNIKTGDEISIESTKTKILGITNNNNDTTNKTNDEKSEIEKILLNPDDFIEAIEYYKEHNNKANKNNIFPMLVSYGKYYDEWKCGISPKFDNMWDLDNPYYINEYLYDNYEIEGEAENCYVINNLNKFKEFVKNADKRFFKFDKDEDNQ